MHKKLIKRKTPTYFGGGEFLKGGGLGNVFKGFTGQSITGKNGLPPTEAEMLNGSIGNGIMAGAKSLGNLLDISNSNMNGAQKNMAMADGAIEGISGVASSFGPVGSAIGMGLNLVNSLGGKLMGTPKAVKDYSINESVSSSSSFGGVNETASQAGASADSYKNAGLAGKLFGKKKLMSNINSANNQMTQTAKILDTNKQALATASQSADMFSARNKNKLNAGNMFTNGSVQFGQKGLKIISYEDVISGNVNNQAILKNKNNNKKVDVEQEETKSFLKSYINSPKYLERLTYFGSVPQKEVIKNRLKAIDETKVIDQYDNPGLLNQFYKKLVNEPYTNQGSVFRPNDNTVIVDNKQIKQQNNLSRSSTIAHELSHAVQNRVPLHPEEQIELMHRIRSDKYYTEHDLSPEENKADIDAFRQELKKQKIVDPGLKDIDSEMLKKSKDSFIKKRLLDHYKEEDLLWLMNHVAKNEKGDKIQFGKKGLKINKDSKLMLFDKASKSLNLKKIKKRVKGNIPLLKEMENCDLINSKIEPLIVVVEGNNEPQYFKDGGTIENKNIIADGVLHARKHDLKNGEFKDADITLKGIPVITKDADGGVIQHAEIEKDELILHFNLTKELEALYKIGDEESMIQAGKLLSKELVKNTKDSKSKILKNA